MSLFHFLYRWPVDQTKGEVAGSEDCSQMVAMLEEVSTKDKEAGSSYDHLILRPQEGASRN